MHLIDEDGHVGNQFTEGNPALGQPATKVGAAWLNTVQAELANAVARAGIVLSKADNAQLASALSILAQGITPGGRLTASSGTPVPTASVSGATTIYYTPYRHALVPLWDGENWVWRTFGELAQALSDTSRSPAAAVANACYDLFVWEDSGGTLRLSRGPAWATDTTRGVGAGTTELERVGGRLVNRYAIANGPDARRGLYVGTIRTQASALVDDTPTRRHVWNAYNRVVRPMVVAGAGNWTYGSDSFRQAGGSTANELDIVCGLAEDAVRAEVIGYARNDGQSDVDIRVGVGIDSTSTDSAQISVPGDLHELSVYASAFARYVGTPGLGRHRIIWLERANGGGTVWNDPARSGLSAELRC